MLTQIMCNTLFIFADKSCCHLHNLLRFAYSNIRFYFSYIGDVSSMSSMLRHQSIFFPAISTLLTFAASCCVGALFLGLVT